MYGAPVFHSVIDTCVQTNIIVNNYLTNVHSKQNHVIRELVCLILLTVVLRQQTKVMFLGLFLFQSPYKQKMFEVNIHHVI